MLFGPLRTSLAKLWSLPNEIAGLRADVRQLQTQVKIMATAQEQTMADLDALSSKLTAYLSAGAAAQQKALDDAKAAWEANDEAAWTAAHTKLSTLIAAVPAGQPVTPPATSSDPSPAPVEAPSIVATPGA